MESRHERNAALVILDDVELPERMRRIERLRTEFGDVSFEFDFASRAGKPRPLDMARDVEMRVIDPPGSGRTGLDALVKSRIGEQAHRQCARQPVDVDGSTEFHHPDDDHAVDRTVHSQPGGVNR